MIEDGKHLIWSWTRVNQAYCKIIRRLSHKPAGGRWRKVVQCDNGRWPQIPRRDITATSICWVAASRVYLHSASFLVQVTQKWKWIWVCRRFDRLTYVSAQSENKIKTPKSEKQVQETFFGRNLSVWSGYVSEVQDSRRDNSIKAGKAITIAAPFDKLCLVS